MNFKLEIEDNKCKVIINGEEQKGISNLDIHCEPNDFFVAYDKYVRENGKLKVVDDEIVKERKLLKMGTINIEYGKEYGDSTSEYIVTTDCNTVRDFINEWLSHQDEWGYFRIFEKDKDFTEWKECEYRYGKLISNPFDDEILDSKLKSVKGSGGWSRSDFVFVLEKE